MEKTQYNLCCKVLRRLDQENVLDHVVLIGSWCLLAYEDLFRNVRYRPGIRTRDIDLLVPIPHRFDHKVDIEALLKDLDFVISYKGKEGYIQFVHQDLMLEFIVPERGRGTGKPYPIPALGVNAQPLRFMDFLTQNTVRVRFADLKVMVPHPANFGLLKLIVAARRTKSVKRENDLRQGVEVLRALIEAGQKKDIQEVFRSMPLQKRKTILQVLQDTPLTEDVVSVLQ